MLLTDQEILKVAKETLEVESEAIKNIINELNNDFVKVVNLIHHSNGRVIVTGIGKSANIGQKIVATFNSTGTPSVFMHAADAIHGDLGIVQQDDIVICISNSGNTPEIKYLIPLLKKSSTKIIGFTGNKNSTLWQEADFSLYTGVEKEACPHDLAPTSSTTVQLAMGDALAVTLLQAKGFRKEDFAKYHPGGALGKKIYTRISEIVTKSEELKVQFDLGVRDLIIKISASRMGAVAVEKEGVLIGIVTDGDIRRMLENHQDFNHLKAADIMTSSPKTVNENILAVKGLDLIKEYNISQLVVVNEENEFVGFVHFHDFMKEGLV